MTAFARVTILRLAFPLPICVQWHISLIAFLFGHAHLLTYYTFTEYKSWHFSCNDPALNTQTRLLGTCPASNSNHQQSQKLTCSNRAMFWKPLCLHCSGSQTGLLTWLCTLNQGWESFLTSKLTTTWTIYSELKTSTVLNISPKHPPDCCSNWRPPARLVSQLSTWTDCSSLSLCVCVSRQRPRDLARFFCFCLSGTTCSST